MVTDKLKHDENAPNVRLMTMLAFGGKDLDFNRSGELSDSQKKRLSHRLWSGIFIYGCLIAILVWAFYEAYQQMHGHFDNNFQVPFFGLLLGISLAVGLLLIYFQRKTLNDASVIAFTGRVRKHSGPNHRILIVINRELDTENIYNVRREEYEAFLDKETYTLYCPSFSVQTILTAEHVPHP